MRPLVRRRPNGCTLAAIGRSAPVRPPCTRGETYGEAAAARVAPRGEGDVSEQDAPAGAGATATDATDPAQAPASQWPAGWYPDALRPWLVRRWDGGAWSDTV